MDKPEKKLAIRQWLAYRQLNRQNKANDLIKLELWRKSRWNF